MLLTSVLCILISLSSTQSSLFFTSPVESTTCVGGKPCILSWINDKALPELSEYGPMIIGLWTGSDTQQIELIKLGNIDPKTSNTLNVVIPSKVTANGNQVFIRMDQISPNHPGDPYQAFSAHFNLSGMTGPAVPVTPPLPHSDGAKGVIGGPNSSIIVAVPSSSPTGLPTVARLSGPSSSSGGLSTASLPILTPTPSPSVSSSSPLSTPQTLPSSVTSNSSSSLTYTLHHLFIFSFISLLSLFILN
ncbi:hypothetical protein DFH28DRAFT_880896 [Melampsora americana]|nr:hypothetical protein DFH28DRAFT_880896 [Melampsora americana]